MKKLILLLVLFCASTTLRAQSMANFANIFVGTTVPSSCRIPSMFIRSTSGDVYTCQSQEVGEVTSNIFVLVGVGSGGTITPSQLPTFTTGTEGNDFNIQVDVDNVNFNLPDAGCTFRGVINNTAQIFCGNKSFQGDMVVEGSLYVTDFLSTDHPLEITIADACVASEANVALLCINPDDNKLYLSADGSAPVEIGAAGGGSTVTVIGNGLTSGGNIIWTGNLNFTISAAEYLIAGNSYSSVQTDLTLSAADATNPRIDIFVVKDDSTVGFITGTPAATPAKPSYDPTTQFEIGFAYIAALATIPSNFTNVNLYLENTEWDTVRSPATDPPWNLASTNNPFAGTVDIEATTAAAGNFVTLTKPAAGTENLASFSNVSFRIRSKATWANPKGLVFTWLNGTTQVGSPVTLKSGTFSFDSSITASYQLVSLPLSLFSTGQNLVTTLKIAVAGGGGSIGFYLDNVLLQAAADSSSDGTVRFADGIVPTGAINGANQTYVLPQVPSPTTSLKCFGNGLRFKLTDDYTFNATTVTITTVGTFQTGDTGLVCDYRY